MAPQVFNDFDESARQEFPALAEYLNHWGLMPNTREDGWAAWIQWKDWWRALNGPDDRENDETDEWSWSTFWGGQAA